MKGDTKIGSNNRFRKSLLALQFFLTFLSISIAIAFIQETKHVKQKSWGYEPSNTMVVTLDENTNVDLIKKDFSQIKSIVSMTGGVQPLGNYNNEIYVNTEGKKELVNSLNVLPGFTEQMGMKIVNGRTFNKDYSTDRSDAVVVNQAFLRLMNWTSSAGKTIEYNNHKYAVIGELADFHYEDFQSDIAPLIVMECKPAEARYLYVKLNSDRSSAIHEEIKNNWQKLYANVPFEYHDQEDVFENYFKGFSQISEVLFITSSIMSVISISGVFGLGLLILGKKMKEISIRKILGADLFSIIYLVYKEFFFALLIALGIGVPLSVFVTINIFKQLSFDSLFSLSPIVLSIVILIMTTTITVSWHVVKAFTANITAYLRRE